MSNNIINADNIFLRRNNISILSGIDWKVEKGQNWAVIGCNGSGKTSLLRSVTGDFWPTTGSLWLFGEQLGFCDLPRLKKRIGWVGSTIDKWLPAHETALNLTVTGLHSTYELYTKPSNTDLAKASSILDSLGCAHLYDRPFQKLSQGEKQKIRLARALVCEPELLILDEVCAGLDIGSREELLDSIEKMTLPNLFYVTHHTEEIPSCISHAIILKSGKVLNSGAKHSTISAENMSKAFGVNISVDFDKDDRIWTRVLKQH